MAPFGQAQGLALTAAKDALLPASGLDMLGLDRPLCTADSTDHRNTPSLCSEIRMLRRPVESAVESGRSGSVNPINYVEIGHSSTFAQ